MFDKYTFKYILIKYALVFCFFTAILGEVFLSKNYEVAVAGKEEYDFFKENLVKKCELTHIKNDYCLDSYQYKNKEIYIFIAILTINIVFITYEVTKKYG